MANEHKTTRSAAEAGWHVSRYNISAKVPETGKTVIVNLLTGSCSEYSSLELFLMSVLDEISENHPIIGLLARRGAICNFDELAAIEADSHIDMLARCKVHAMQTTLDGIGAAHDATRHLAVGRRPEPSGLLQFAFHLHIHRLLANVENGEM